MRVVLADDQALLRESIAEALTARGIDVAGQAEDVPGLLEVVERTLPDVAIVDIRMPPAHRVEGLEATRIIRSRWPGVAVLLLSHHVETAIAVDLLRDNPGRLGYLLKDRVTRIDVLVDAIERLAAGGVVIDPGIVSRLLGRRRDHDPLDELTTRERDVLAQMAEGRSNRGIAARLGIEDKTVEYHVTQILGKLGIEPEGADHRRVLAVIMWLRRGVERS
jgi:DNA-binding NarL/FixJ family response regulator